MINFASIDPTTVIFSSLVSEWGGGTDSDRKKMYSLNFVLMLYIKFQNPSSGGSLVLIQKE